MAVLQIKYSTAAGHVPSGLVSGQLAINIADGVLFWINSAGVQQSFAFGSPIVATMGGSDSSGHAASTSFVQGLLSALTVNAPATLNTFAEVAAAINNDPNFYQTINNILVGMLRFDVAQTLSGAQTKQLWANIGLGSNGTIDGSQSVIQVKRSIVTGAAPSSLQPGEFYVNQADGILYWANSNAVIESMPLYGAPIESMRSNNIVINGAMEVCQRFSSNSAQNVGTGGYITDQFYCSFVHAGATFTALQSTAGGPIGSPYYLNMTATAPITSYAAADYALVQTRIEGYRWSRLMYGTANAKVATLGFWVYALVTGVGTVSIRNASNTRTYLQDFNVTGSQWNYVVMTIPGDAIGTWLNDTSMGCLITWAFGGGSSYVGTNKVWQSGNVIVTANTTNFFGTTGNYVGLTGVFMIPGAYSIPAVNAPQLIPALDFTLEECLRYYETGVEPLTYVNTLSGVTQAYDTMYFKKRKRTTPSIVCTGWTYYSQGTPTNFTPLINAVDITRFEYLGQSFSNWTGWSHGGTWAANASL